MIYKATKEFTDGYVTFMVALQAYDIHTHDGCKCNKRKLYQEIFDNHQLLCRNECFHVEKDVTFSLIKSGMHKDFVLIRRNVNDENADELYREKAREIILKKTSNITRKLHGRPNNKGKFETSFDEIADIVVKAGELVFNRYSEIVQDIDKTYN